MRNKHFDIIVILVIIFALSLGTFIVVRQNSVLQIKEQAHASGYDASQYNNESETDPKKQPTDSADPGKSPDNFVNGKDPEISNQAAKSVIEEINTTPQNDQQEQKQ